MEFFAVTMSLQGARLPLIVARCREHSGLDDDDVGGVRNLNEG
jgi:hypothetical protein